LASTTMNRPIRERDAGHLMPLTDSIAQQQPSLMESAFSYRQRFTVQRLICCERLSVNLSHSSRACFCYRMWYRLS
jgi:hypothetical protein